ERSTTSWTVNSLSEAVFISSSAASRNRCTRFSARARAGSSDRATACSRQLGALSDASAAASSDAMSRRLDGGLDDNVHGGGAAVGHSLLPPHLDGERGVDQRVAQPQKPSGVLRQGREVELI